MAYDPKTLKWSVLRKAVMHPQQIKNMLEAAKSDREIEVIMDIVNNEKVFINHLYQVNVREEIKDGITLKHLSIKLRTKEIIKDWRHFQLIKNQICGKEWIGLEFYPPESKLVDTANQYHIYCFPPECVEWFPFIFQERIVSEPIDGKAKQRPFEVKPDDMLSEEEMRKRMIDTGYGVMIT